MALSRSVSTPLIWFAILWLSFAYFHHTEAGWNVNTRLALTYAIVEQGTLAIDFYHDNPGMPYLRTGDKAFFRGHYYCDKSPGVSFLAVPTYALLWNAKMQLGFMGNAPHERWVHCSRYLMCVDVVATSAALLGVLLWALAMCFGASSRLALALSGGLLWGTLLSGYATLFYAYVPAALFLAGAYWVLLTGRLAEMDGGDSPLGQGARLFWAGLLVGLAWFFEFTCGLAGLGLAAYAAWAMRRRPLRLWKFIAGGLVPVGLFCAYAYSIFGECAIPYKYESDAFFREQMALGFQGIHWPRLSVLYYITIHPYRGLFFFSPFLLLWIPAVFASGRATRATTHRFLPDVLLSLYIVAAYFAFNCGYYMWWGGWTAGPRFLCPAVPFFLGPLALWLRGAGVAKRAAFGALLALSLALNFAITAHNPQAPTRDIPQAAIERERAACIAERREPISRNDLLVQTLMDARIGDNLPSPVLLRTYPEFLRGKVASNLGSEFLGLRGWWSLAPLGMLGLWACFWWWRQEDENAP